jgi:hypothetical protein
VTQIQRLVGVYDADHTIRGELAYWIGARLGRAHCSLCDITHGTFRVRDEWTTCRAGLPITFDTFHRDDQPPAVRSAVDGVAPVVVAETTDGITLLLGPDQLEACDGSVELLMDAIQSAVATAGLTWTG